MCNITSSQAMASDEIADLFGDFDSADESQGASQGAAASSSTVAPVWPTTRAN